MGHLADINGTSHQVARDMLEQARRDVGEFRNQEWAPKQMIQTLLLEIMFAAHMAQIDHSQMGDIMGELAPAYYDLVGQFLDKRGETQEARDRTVGVRVPVQAYPH